MVQAINTRRTPLRNSTMAGTCVGSSMNTHAIGECHDIAAHKDGKPVETRRAEVEVGRCMLATKCDTNPDVGRRGAAGEDPVLADVEVDVAEAYSILVAGSPRRSARVYLSCHNR